MKPTVLRTRGPPQLRSKRAVAGLRARCAPVSELLVDLRKVGGRCRKQPRPGTYGGSKMQRKSKARAGVRPRHRRPCATSSGGRCTCKPGWEGYVWINRDGRKERRTFSTRAAAQAWVNDAKRAVRLGQMRAATRTTVREAAASWLRDAEAGIIRNRSGDLFKPATLRRSE